MKNEKHFNERKQITYTVETIRSSRRTLAIEVKPDGRVIARAPYRIKQSEVERFIEEKSPWIEKQLQKLKTSRREINAEEQLTEEELSNLTERAKKYIPQRVAFYAEKIGVDYGKITIRCQKTKWGSCSSQGNLNFNCLLMLAPAEVIDSVVVHELCHRKEMNHSERFYQEVLRVYPDYRKHYQWLRDNGSAIMSRRM